MKLSSSPANSIPPANSTVAGSKRRRSPRFSFTCGCKDTKSIAISEPSMKSTPTPRNPAETLSSGEIPSYSGLLRQLKDLEQSVRSWRGPSQSHRRCRSEGSGRIEESVAVVKVSDDPIGDFRRSMLVMIVEKEIVDGDELCELVDRFISLNSPRHHDLIHRAFAEIWDGVFLGCKIEAAAPEILRRSSTAPARRRR
ncbi:Ovate protein family C-terminal protein [Dioscorea alata]|uniref:Ovate protein family C-terminal protein n=1 Tax=Dioscorea alata TaxID=55571 RepID=A0ACB7WNF5_DIOAL|nr:Ovate protein family C-terminal protein [Dioscorea alata]